VVLHELSSRLEGLELALELGYTYDTRDKLDILGREQILVLSLRVLGNQTYRGRAGVNDRSCQGTRQM
jgi:hypothetical protein